MTLTFSNLDAQRAFGGKLIVGLMWLMVLVVAAARLGAHGPLLGVLVGSVAFAAGATFAWRAAGHRAVGRALTGVALMAQVSMLVAAMSGHGWQIDMHMAYFAALALLVIYCDWIVIAAAAATVAVHHLGLSYLLPAAVFPGSASLGRVVVHAVILIVEAVILIGVTSSVNAMFRIADDARAKAEAALAAANDANQAADLARHSEESGRAEFADIQAKAEQRRADAVAALAKELSRLAAGDLTARIEADFDSDYAQIKIDFNEAVDSLRTAMAAISVASEGMRGGSDEISKASDNLSRRTEQQAASLEETAAALDQITVTVKQGAEGAKQASSIVSSARSDAERSGEVVRNAVTAMGEIKRSSEQITQIIGVIDEIAFQTNLLALNAGVEAARAGESGRGFAVVAQEVRALAQRSAEAAKQIKSLIASSGQQVERGVDLVGDTGEALVGIVAKVAEIDTLVSAIAVSSQEQATSLSQVNVAVNQMDQVTQQNAAMVEQSTAASHSLAHEAVTLAGLIDRFEVSDSVRPGQSAPAPAARRARA